MIDAHPSRPRLPGLPARRSSLFWRIHFWAALIASPFVLVAVLTGILYVFTPQIEAVLYDRLDHVAPGSSARPLDQIVAAANAAVPEDMMLRSVQPAYRAGDTAKLIFAPGDGAGHGARAGHEGHQMGAAETGPVKPAASRRPAPSLEETALIVYVNPYTAEVVGTLAARDRFNLWAKRLHARLLQGDGWRWMIELAASWLMVMLLTGIWLWWPRGMQKALPQRAATGRLAWKQWHGFLGVALALVSLVIVATGLTWSKQSGAQIRALVDATGQSSPKAPGGLASVRRDGAAMLTWQAASELVRTTAPEVAFQLTAPKGEQGVWRAASADRSQPGRRYELAFDAYSGRRLYYAGWDNDSAFGKATALGIPFHRGEFGWWNQAILFVFGAGVLLSLLSGWVMFFKRRQAGTLGLPRLLPGAWRSASLASLAVAAALCATMPLLALSAAAVLALEWLLHRRFRPASAPL